MEENEILSELERVADERVDVEAEVIEKDFHKKFFLRLWKEIKLLPLNQRRALLLHLERDELLVFVHHGACSLREVARVLEMDWDDFTEVYSRIPLDDRETARRFGLANRQKVINLRKCARERLKRRLESWLKESSW